MIRRTPVRFSDPLKQAHPDFLLSQAGWELYHRPRMQRANWPLQPERAAKSNPTTEGKQSMRGMQRLANLAETIMSDIDKEADAVADELVAAKKSAQESIGHFREHAGAIKKVADDVKAQLGQISNIPPGSQG